MIKFDVSLSKTAVVYTVNQLEILTLNPHYYYIIMRLDLHYYNIM